MYKKKIIFLIVFFWILDFQISKLEASCDKTCDRQVVNKILKDNSKFASEFVQIDQMEKKKYGFFELNKNKSIKINYKNPKIKISFDQSGYIYYHNLKLNSVKKIKNDNPIFDLLLNADLNQILKNDNYHVSCSKPDQKNQFFLEIQSSQKNKNFFTKLVFEKNVDKFELKEIQNQIFNGKKISKFVKFIFFNVKNS